MTMTRTKNDIYQEIRRLSQTSLGSTESERILNYVGKHPELYDEYVRAPQALPAKPSPSPAPLTAGEASIAFRLNPNSRQAAEQAIDLKARELMAKERVDYRTAVGRILAGDQALNAAYHRPIA